MVRLSNVRSLSERGLGHAVAFTDATITDPDVLRQRFAEIRKSGFGLDEGQCLLGGADGT